MLKRCSQAIAVIATTLIAAVAATGAAPAAIQGQTLTVALGFFPASLDPATGQSEYLDFTELAYEPLIVEKPDGTFASGLATKWAYGPRNKSFSLTLRPGVRFSDGTRLDAVAVKTWMEHVLKLPGALGQGYLRHLTATTVTGPLSVRLTFDTPTPLLEQVFSNELEAVDVGSPRAVTAGTLATQTDGTGPYMLDPAQTVPQDHYTYVPNPHYWNKPAVHWAKVVVRVISNPSSTISAMQTGQVQFATHQPTESIEAAKHAGLKAASAAQNFYGLSLQDRDGLLRSPLADLRVRQAINYAIDRREVTKALYGSYGTPTDETVVSGADSYDPALERRYPYDPAKAKQLLVAAGYPNGFTLSTVSANGLMATFAEAVAGQLAKVGIKLQLDVKVGADAYFAGIVNAKYPAAVVILASLPAASDYAVLYGPTAPFNPLHTTNLTLEHLYFKLIEAPATKAGAIARQMERLLVTRAWFAPVSANGLVSFYRPQIAGINVTKARPVWYMPELRPAS
jgi:peptide/nickel transport system substrate-binding protein